MMHDTVKVLLVEDNPPDALLIREMLDDASGVRFDLEHVELLAEGLTRLGEGGINAVLLDLGLPDSQGLETFSKVYASFPHVPVIVLSGLDDEEVAIEAVRRGAQDYLPKGRLDSKLLGLSVRYGVERKKAEEEKVKMQQQIMLSGRLAAVGQLAAGVAHELNNPLAAVQGHAQLLASMKDLDEGIRSDVETIYAQAQRACAITANLLSFAREHECESGPTSINEAVEKSLELNDHSLKANGIQVRTELDPQLPLTMADFFRLQQVFVNIVANAVHAMTEAHGQGTLAIRTQRLGNVIQASFADDGPGIPEEDLTRLFDPFFTTKDVGKGTGLGLSICFGIVEQHGGTIRASSEPGKGATLVVEIPVVADDPAGTGEPLSIRESVATPAE
jgi:signal transduction histidine kinase